MRTTITLDDAIFIAAREVANQSGKSIGCVLSEWARQGLRAAMRNPRDPIGRRFPVFDVPDSAPPITSETVKRLLNDEGIPARH